MLYIVRDPGRFRIYRSNIVMPNTYFTLTYLLQRGLTCIYIQTTMSDISSKLVSEPSLAPHRRMISHIPKRRHLRAPLQDLQKPNKSALRSLSKSLPNKESQPKGEKTHQPPKPNTTSDSPRHQSTFHRNPSGQRNPNSAVGRRVRGWRRGYPSNRPGRRRRDLGLRSWMGRRIGTILGR